MKNTEKYRTVIEPFKIKSVEPIRMTTRQERENILAQAGLNPFMIKSQDVIIDFLTDSGTSAMSAAQWGAIMVGDEAYAGARSFYRFQEKVQDIFGFPIVIPTHQGRAAEKILFSTICGPGKFVPNNTHFDTTRANVEFAGATAVDCLTEEGKDPSLITPFKGNMDLEKLEAVIRERGAENIPVVMLTVTNNSGGGQPVSMKNIRGVSELCRKYDIPFFFDACRFAENAYFIKLREPGYASKTPLEIAREMFSYADGCTMSAKKDALVNMGGFIALRNEEWAQQFRNILIITEGFPTYGGLSGRDLEAIAQGLDEVLDEDYLHYRIISTAYLADHIAELGVPILQPPGGHAVYVDAKAMCPHIPIEQYPGQAIVCGLYLEGGVRAVEIGSVMFGTYDESGKLIPAPLELVRLAIPRRVYTQSHMDYVVEVFEELVRNRDALRGVRIVKEAPVLRHFTAQFEYV